MWQLLKSSLCEDFHAALEYRAHVKPTHVLCSIQLTMYSWFSHRRARLTPPTPDLKSIINQILMQVYVLPMLPLPLYQLAYPKKPFLMSVPGSVATGSSLSLVTSGSGSDRSGTTTVSGLSLGSSTQGFSQPTQPTQPAGTRGARIANLQPIQSIAALLPSTTKLRDLVRAYSPPKLDNGSEMCLSFLLRGG